MTLYFQKHRRDQTMYIHRSTSYRLQTTAHDSPINRTLRFFLVSPEQPSSLFRRAYTTRWIQLMFYPECRCLSTINRFLPRCDVPFNVCTLFRNYREHETMKLCYPRVLLISARSSSATPTIGKFTLRFRFRRSSVGTFIRQQPLTSSGSSSVDSSRGSKTSTTAPRLDYRSMVSVEDMPELFVSFDSKYLGICLLYRTRQFIQHIFGMINPR